MICRIYFSDGPLPKSNASATQLLQVGCKYFASFLQLFAAKLRQMRFSFATLVFWQSAKLAENSSGTYLAQCAGKWSLVNDPCSSYHTVCHNLLPMNLFFPFLHTVKKFLHMKINVPVSSEVDPCVIEVLIDIWIDIVLMCWIFQVQWWFTHQG